MSKKTYILSVPKPAEDESFPHFVAHGNLEAELTPGGTYETDNENFARHLIDRYGLTLKETVETEDEPATDAEPVDEKDPEPIDPETYPEDFPGRDALIEQNVAFETLRGLSGDQLTAYKGIGPKTAESIVEYFAAGGTE